MTRPLDDLEDVVDTSRISVAVFAATLVLRPNLGTQNRRTSRHSQAAKICNADTDTSRAPCIRRVTSPVTDKTSTDKLEKVSDRVSSSATERPERNKQRPRGGRSGGFFLGGVGRGLCWEGSLWQPFAKGGMITMINGKLIWFLCQCRKSCWGKDLGREGVADADFATLLNWHSQILPPSKTGFVGFGQNML